MAKTTEKIAPLKKDGVLSEISQKATKLGESVYKHNTKITHAITESVLEATSNVIREQLNIKDPGAVVHVPHFGAFKSQFKPGGEREVNIPGRNGEPARREMRFKGDTHIVKFKPGKKFRDAFQEMREKTFKK